MHLNLVGINHRTAPITIREKIAIGNDKLPDALSKLRSYLPQSIILSTCNRTEIYTVDADVKSAENASLAFLKNRLDITAKELHQYVKRLNDKQAIEHLFRVACGLESMIVGEFEVLGQVRQALEIAEKNNMINLPLRVVFNSAVRAGRNVRQETGISKNALSVSSVAVELASKVFGDLSQCNILVIGTGEAGRLVAKAARERGISHITIASRNKERARVLAEQLGGLPVDLNSLHRQLIQANIVVTCAGAPHTILDVCHLAKAISERDSLPLVIIDIAMPRNVDPRIGQIGNIFLYNIDDLTEISNANRKLRENAVQKAEMIIQAEVDKLMSWWQTYETRPVINTLMGKAEKIRSTQFNKTIKTLPPLSGEHLDNLEAMTKSIVIRILQDPIQYLKNSKNKDHSDVIKELFQLDMETN